MSINYTHMSYVEELVELDCDIEETQAQIVELEESVAHCQHCECSSAIQRINFLKGKEEHLRAVRLDMEICQAI